MKKLLIIAPLMLASASALAGTCRLAKITPLEGQFSDRDIEYDIGVTLTSKIKVECMGATDNDQIRYTLLINDNSQIQTAENWQHGHKLSYVLLRNSAKQNTPTPIGEDRVIATHAVELDSGVRKEFTHALHAKILDRQFVAVGDYTKQISVTLEVQ